MAVRFYWTLVLIAGHSEYRDNAAVDEAQFMVDQTLGSQGIAGNSLDPRRSSPIFFGVGENDRMKEEALQAR